MTGSGNTTLGYESLQIATTGSKNTALGTRALSFNLTGSRNTGIGYDALEDVSADNNTAVGFRVLQFLSSGSNNIAIGPSAGNAISTRNNNIYIGNSGFSDEGDVIRIGTTQTKAVMLGIYPTTISSAGVFTKPNLAEKVEMSKSRPPVMPPNPVAEEVNGCLLSEAF
jgi:hypothetical protein